MALRRRFGKKLYYFDSEYRQSDRAYGQAARLRRAGNKARVIKSKWGTWEVWARSPEDK